MTNATPISDHPAFKANMDNITRAKMLRASRRRSSNQISFMEATGDVNGLKMVMKEAMEAYERLTDER